MVTATELAAPDVGTLEQEVSPLVQWARSLTVTTAEDFAYAAERLKEIKGMAKRVAEFFSPTKRAQDEAKKRILEAERKLTVPLDEAEALTKRALLVYQQAEEAKRLAEQRKLQAEADERARREREALAKKAAAAKKPETQQRYAEQAASVIAPVVQVASAAPKVTGMATRKVWKARVVDENKVPREFLTVDETKLNAFAKAMREQAKVEGVVFYTEDVLAASSR